MVECPTCKRALKNESALMQHCRDKGHPYPAPAATSSTAAVASSSKGPHVLIECTRCSATFTDKLSYDQHVVSKHPSKPYKCVPCAVEFSTAEALSGHFKLLAVHPKCPTCSAAFVDQTQLNLHQGAHPKCTKCGSVFFNRVQLDEHVAVAHPVWRCVKCLSVFSNRVQLDEHVAVAHPVWKCVPCGREYATAAARKSHYQDSSSHPICFICREGFENDVELDNHLAQAHIDAKCIPCNRQFRQVENLQNHYLTSAVHPHCAMCEIGFPDDEACEKHMTTNHPRPPPPPRTPSPLSYVTPSPIPSHSEIAHALPSVEIDAPARSVYSSPRGQRPALNGVSITTSLSVARVESDDDHDVRTYQTVEASSHVQRAISEPTVPTASSLGYGSVHDPAESAWRSPTISERSVEYSNIRGMPRHPQSESTISLQSAPSSSILGSSPRFESSMAYHPLPPSQPPRVPDSSASASGMPTGRSTAGGAGLISQSISPRIQSPINSTRSFSSLAEHIARNAAPTIRPSLSRQPTPRIPSPVLSRSPSLARAHSRTAAQSPSVSVFRGTSRPASSLHSNSKSFDPAVGAGPGKASSKVSESESLASDTDADTEETVPGSTVTPKAAATSIPFSKSKHASKAKAKTTAMAKAGGVSFHCRICKQDPCAAPTATMCGHIFCTPCIVHELLKTGTCPVCRKTILLRLNVEPDVE